jgi:DNA helicase II / ATP-dependent DNA helicase PcrA
LADGKVVLTAEQKEAVRFDHNMMLTACPGSGKTRVIVSKLSRVLDQLRGTARNVACVTYTNSGVHEIESRLRHHIQPGDEAHYDIGTIHSFCLHHIFRPFCYLVPGFEKGFTVLTPESPEFEAHVKGACERHGRLNLTFKELDEFTQVQIDSSGEPCGGVLMRGAITAQLAKLYWSRIWKAGLVDFQSIIYFSLKLLRDRPEILGCIASKFAWILIDEFQDTSDLQVEIMTVIAKKGRTKFLLVGDPYQSIFGFAGARPDLAETFAARIQARTNLTLSGNFRSSKPIVEQANLLFPRKPPMVAIGAARTFSEVPTWHQAATPFDAVVNYFLPALEQLKIPIGNAAVLAPTWFSLFPLGRKLREYGISIVGPGARPYRRNRHFAPLAEQICGYLMEPRPEAVCHIERTLFHTVLDVTGRANFALFSYEGRVVVFRLLHCARTLFKQSASGVKWLEVAASAFGDILIEEDLFSPSERHIFSMSAEEMKADMRNNKVDLGSLAVEDLGIYASPEAALKLATLHFSKGREFDAVAMIDMHEGKIPHFTARSAEEIDDGKRNFYVGLTRARRLVMYLTDKSDARNRPTRFLSKGSGVGVCG